MNILFLAHRVPFPADKGDRIRSYNIIKLLAKFHSVFLMAATHEPVHPQARSTLGRYCEAVDIFEINPQLSKLRGAMCLFTKRPLTLSHFYSRALQQAVQERLKGTRIDLIFIFSSPMAQYVLDVRNVRKLVDFIDLDSQKWLDYASKTPQPMKSIYYREGITLRSFEKKIATLCDHHIFSTEREARLFRELVPDASCSVVQNGVDVHETLTSESNGNKLIFVGAMDYLPNVDAMIYFTQDILPLVQRSIPEVELYIVGRNPSRQIRKLSRLKNVVVTGYVDKILPYLRSAAASIAPLRIARGIQNKVLEAMAHGVPVVGSSAALEGIEAQPGRDVLVADEPSGFAQKTVAVLKDLSLRRSLSENALALVQEKYSWETRLKCLEESIAQVIS